MKTFAHRALPALPLVFLCLFSDAAVSAPNKEDASNPLILTVNGDRITAKDLKRELDFRARQDPSFKVTPDASKQQLETMINRRVMIQDAVKRRLAEEETFVSTIRNFWEQTLIRNLLTQVGAEVEKSVKVTDAEIQDFYSKLSEKVSFEVARSVDRKTIDALTENVKKGEPVAWDEKLGPAMFTELSSPALEDAFSMKAGEWKVYLEKGLYYLIRVSAREPATPPAMQEIRKQIEDTLKQRKVRDGLEVWLQKKRADAKIVLPQK